MTATDPIIAEFRKRDRASNRESRRSLDDQAIGGLLAQDERGQVMPTLANALVCMAHDPALVGLVGFDEFRDQAFLMRAPPVANDGDPPTPGPYPRAWMRSDVALTAAYIQRERCQRMRREAVEDAMEAEASRARFHPVRRYLDSLQWDGCARLATWLNAAFGSPINPYTEAVGAKTLIAAVRRVRKPGVKFDHVPVAQGGQGIGKSSTWAALCGPEWFSDALPDDLGDKDAAMALRGVWFLEMAELTQLLASEPEAVKAFVTRSVDRYRPPYGRQVVEVPRQGVLVGTTNAQEYLRDATGNRRWWPFDCSKADAQWVRSARDQLWAEANHREAQGEPHWLDDADARDEAREQQEDRMVEDPWHDRVREFLTGLGRTTTSRILTEAIQMAVERQNRAAQMRISAILTRMGWVARRNGAGRWWERPL